MCATILRILLRVRGEPLSPQLDARNEICLRTRVAHVALSADQNCLLCGTLDSTLRLLDKASGQVLCEYRGHQNASYKLASCLSQDDSKVLSGSEEGTLHVWDLVEGKQLLKKRVHAGPVVALCCHPKSSAVLTGSHDGTCKLWAS